jgi:predicted nucleotidyltransferase
MVTYSEIQDWGARVGAEFNPDRVILFGSHAYGTPTEDSDVDALVVMPHEGKGWRMATEIRRSTHPGFPLDLLVRTPEQYRKRLDMGDCFMREIEEKGTVLYERTDG